MTFSKLLAVALVATAAAQAMPAEAAVPGCATYSALTPYRQSQIGPDLVKANFSMSNWCSDAADIFHVGLSLQTKRCGFPSTCGWGTMRFLEFTSTPQTQNGWEVSAECRDGKHRYRLFWEIRDEERDLLAYGYTSDPELTCDTDLPDCPVRPQIPLPGCGSVGTDRSTLTGTMEVSS